MNKQQATNEGLYFTGMYESQWEHEKVERLKLRIKNIRKEYKCRIVLVKEEGGYSAYADEKYSDIEIMKSYHTQLYYIESRRKRAEERYQKEMQEIAKDEERFTSFINNFFFVFI